MTRLVILESPYAGDVEANLAYCRAAMADCLRRGEAPLASHALYTQPGVLDDGKPEERALGIAAGLAWGAVADATVVYTDRGVSSGMQQGVTRAREEGRPVEFRTLPKGPTPYEQWRERAGERGVRVQAKAGSTVPSQPTGQEFMEIEDGTGARFILEEGHDCYTDPRCCRYCETHEGCRCDGDYYGRRYA